MEMTFQDATSLVLTTSVITMWARVAGMSVYMLFHASAFASDREKIDTAATGFLAFLMIIGQADVVATHIGDILGFGRSLLWSIIDLMAGFGFLTVLQHRRQFYLYVEKDMAEASHAFFDQA